MSDTEKQVEEQVKNAVNANAAPAQSTELKNDAEDLGQAVVKPTDTNPDATKKIKKVSDQVNKDANDGSLPNDQKPSSVKKEEVESGEEVSEMAGGNMMAMKKPMNAMKKPMNAMKKMEADDADSKEDKKEMMMKDKMKKDEMAKMKKESAEEV